MALKCKNCGGDCKPTSNGEYECTCCGASFGKDDLMPKQKKAAETNDNGGIDVFDKNINGILEIRCAGQKGSWSGSGYIVSNNGYAITNAHVAADDVDGKPCKQMVVKVCNQAIPATVIALADDKAGHGNGVDLALIKMAQMPRDAVALEFEDFNNVRNGEKVYVIGNSLGYGTCITSGIVSDRLRNVNGNMLLMTDCAVNPGNSGGPMFNEKGLIIGTIVSGIDGAEGMNFAIPENIVQDFLLAVKNKFNIRF